MRTKESAAKTNSGRWQSVLALHDTNNDANKQQCFL